MSQDGFLTSAIFFPDFDPNNTPRAYESPIVEILQEIRRKNVAAAATSNAQYLSIDDANSDPWDSLSEDANQHHHQEPWLSSSSTPLIVDSTATWTCICPPKSPGRVSVALASSSPSGAVCQICGKKKKSQRVHASPWAARRSRSISYSAEQILAQPSLATPNNIDPQHALAMLHSTPQLRILCPASTDMTFSGKVGDRNLLMHLFSGEKTKELTVSSTSASVEEYKQSLLRDRTNQQAASELASLLWVLSHEMTLEDYGVVESEVFSSVFGLVHSAEKEKRMAGLACVDALLAVPSADEEKKAIKFANTLSTGLRAAHGDYEFLSAVSRALGHMARRTANVDFVESEVTRALEWLRTDRSERRLAACLSLKEFAINAPTTFHSKTSQSTLGQSGSNVFLDIIFNAIHDPQPIVRTCAVDALSQCLKILVDRRHVSLTGLLCQVHFAMIDGLHAEPPEKRRTWQSINAADAKHHGSLLVVSTMLAYTREFIAPRFEEMCREILVFTKSKLALIRLEVVRLVPRLALRCPKDFGRRYLQQFLTFLLECATAPAAPRTGVDIKPFAITAIGHLILAMVDEETGEVIGASDLPTLRILDDPDNVGTGQIVELTECGFIRRRLSDMFLLVRRGLSASTGTNMLSPALHCAANLVEALGDLALPYTANLIDDMFRAGLSTDLIRCLHSMARCVPAQQSRIQERMLQEVSFCLAGTRDVYHPLASFQRSSFWRTDSYKNAPGRTRPEIRALANADGGTEKTDGMIRINMANDEATVATLVLSLQTLASFGGTTVRVSSSGAVVPLLPYVQEVAAQYLVHPSDDVRRAAATTCCVLLIPHEATNKGKIGSHSGLIIENVLGQLIPVAVSDPSPMVRLCVVRALDARYDPYLCQHHHLQELFLLLQDDNVATRGAGLRLLGRLASRNPAPTLPVMRKFLNDIIVELQCGVHGRGREDATRLLGVFLRADSLGRLVHPVLASLITALPLDKSAPPRLASASLEALGDLAVATGVSLKPWVHDVIPHLLEIMQDQSSASKQKTSLRTLGQIASSTGYVIRPYLDNPQLLSQVTNILPATKRAPWSLRREVIRTLGIVGALDPDRYHGVATMTRKSGAVGGAYFEEMDVHPLGDGTVTKNSVSEVGNVDVDDDQPAFLFMYEQYAMVAQPVSTLPPARRLNPSSEDFYPTVAIQALMRIFRDPALAVHHSMVIQAIMFIFKSLGLGCVPYLKKVVPYMIERIRTTSPSNLREALLKELASLSLIAREHLRPYIADMFDVVEQYWSSRHLATVLSLVSKTAVGVPDEFRRFVPRLIRLLLTSLDELQIADWSADSNGLFVEKGRVESEKLALILRSVCNLKGVLGDYLHVLVPAFLKLADSLAYLLRNPYYGVSDSVLLELLVLVCRTISSLLESQKSPVNKLSLVYFADDKFTSPKSSENGLPSRVVQPFVHILRVHSPRNPAIALAIIETLCVCASLIGGAKWVQLYDGVVRETIDAWQDTFPILPNDPLPTYSFRLDERTLSCLDLYDEAIEDLLKPPPQRQRSPSIHRANSVMFDGSHHQNRVDPSLFGSGYDGSFDQHLSILQSPSNHGSRRRVNQISLQRAWDVSQRSSRDDWDEWMRRFAIQLLREAPSPSLRATANLAHAYQPLARELFSAAFGCCWKELSQPYRVNLVTALETAFVSDVSPEILQQLLNLCEFMEHDPSGGLPIDISILADLALTCRAYAKALHYREREYNQVRSNSCVESLISINRKLDLQDAALGVLKASSIDSVLKEQAPLQLDLPSKTSGEHAYDMSFSVTWSTADSEAYRPLDLTAKQELWLMKLGSWTEALAAYQKKLEHDPMDFEALLGCMRCLDASGEWRSVLGLFQENLAAMAIPSVSRNLQLRADIPPRHKRKAIRMCAHAAWRLGQWDDLEQFSSELVRERTIPHSGSASLVHGGADNPLTAIDFDGAFYSAVLHVHRNEWNDAAEAIDAARKAMDSRLTALMAESYSRAYPSMVTAQTLAELEEIIELRKVEDKSKNSTNQHPANRPSEEFARERLLTVWRERLAGCRVDAEVHASILAVRSLVLSPTDEIEATLRLSTLSRQAQRFKFAERVLLRPLADLGADINGPLFGFGLQETLGSRTGFSNLDNLSITAVIEQIVNTGVNFLPMYGPSHQQWSKNIVNEAGGYQRLTLQHRLYLAYVNHLWFTNSQEEAMKRLQNLCDVVDLVSSCESVQNSSLNVTCWLELGEWKLTMSTLPNTSMPDRLQADVLTAFRRATVIPNCGYRAWHAWALLNFRIAIQLSEQGDLQSDVNRRQASEKTQRSHIIAAVKGFVNAISMGKRKESASVQQDLLNLLTCLFKYGNLPDVSNAINECIGSVELEAWLGVLPQVLARIHIKDPNIRAILHPLLVRLGQKHPQALMYPLSVLLKSPVLERKSSAESLMLSLKEHSSELVEEALMVSSELIRVAILWLETWHEGLEDASRLYFVEGNVSGMLDILLPLHEKVEAGGETMLEREFLKNYGHDLATAHMHIKDYIRLVVVEGGSSVPTGGMASARNNRQSEEAEAAMNRAWDIYYTFFRRVNKQLPSLTSLELSQCSPALYRARSLELGVPGTYRVDGSYVKIDKFISNINVITSKQRPRKITLRGSDGNDYMFLLKGHEDLRQDERVMQLFGLVNALLVRDSQTRKQDLKIQRYAICPLSHNCGVVGWVPHCDTLHSLIRDYRQAKKIPLNMENREMLKIAPDYDLLTVMQKVEVFTEASKKTTGRGNDLYEILWLKSTNSEEWLERRTRYTRSLAVMSIVGYILGLGDRHPSNLMIDKVSGRVLHIDFGDCFEVAMMRDKFPEKVPFRLTRMLIKAMEVSGIEGSYRSTCERTMSVLRGSRDSLVAMLEAFVYDPLISWRLVGLSPGAPSDLSNERMNPERGQLRTDDGSSATLSSGNPSTMPIDLTERANRADRINTVPEPISEHPDEDDEERDDQQVDADVVVGNPSVGGSQGRGLAFRPGAAVTGTGASSSATLNRTARSLQMYSSIQSLAANIASESRIASITGDRSEHTIAAEGSMARSRVERSMRQRELHSIMDGEQGVTAHEEALNEKALKVIRRVQDKLTGTDFVDNLGEPVDVPDQVQRLIVQATSTENLCQLFIGWCAFW